ncbi:FeS assembly SUF system protein SufT [Methylacidiphilum kamchatkense Kam1]|uniref:FeS assembly SUF system protein SufT n=1 Tax=Methylacidiphilum kamchatkense Kam1 TaxID=1202785 RepID=A0A0C1RU79_9BACT|nr:putative Fe-S cluster assembly protein SufT [Methylacidiphilum kamchatkense]KIE58551.1 FeS assembly SUF system protein SufT [Methylacidiphilum kamchatkense Kam1]QDQ43376.1 putative FeS assembly SUF system protein SufT [Methylacidiphilum kamchatkense Kam1]
MNVNSSQSKLSRDLEAILIPSGEKVQLQKDKPFQITQSMGGSYTLIYDNRLLVRVDSKDADALGIQQELSSQKEILSEHEELTEEIIYSRLKEVYDPEIPVNIVDLGLVYDCQIKRKEDGSYSVAVKMTLTAPGCGMGTILAQDAQSRILEIPSVSEAQVDLVWDPPWNPSMISEEGKMILGLV